MLRSRARPATYQIIYNKSRAEFADLFLRGIPTENRYSLSQSLNYIPKSPMPRAVSKQWPQTVWFRLEGMYPHPVGRIEIGGCLYFILRNGNNVHTSNFAVLDGKNEKFYFRYSFGLAMEVLEILSLPDKELPLLISRKMAKANEELLLKRFKGES